MLPDRATVQAVGRPQFAAALAQQGRPVLIRRAGQPDAQERALLVPASSQARAQGRSGAEVASPEYGATTWKVFFAHTADGVRAPGFLLAAPAALGQPELLLVPTAPAVDVADQGVVLMVVGAPLVDRTRVERLVFTTPGTGTVRDAKGNLVPAPGVPLPVSARLVPTTDPKLRESVGADSASVVLIGRWGTLERPLLKPDGVRWGSTSPLTLDGQPGTLTVKLAYPDPDLAQEAQFGARWVGVWKAGT